MNRIKIDTKDKDLLLEILDWIELRTSNDPILKENARRVVYYLNKEDLEIPLKYLKYIRRAFPAFYESYPNKKEAGEELRRKLSDIINEKTKDNLIQGNP